MDQDNKQPKKAKGKTKKSGGRKELTFAGFVIFPDGRTVQVDELTPEEYAQWQANMLRRLSENMSDYYTQHPDQYARL